jgi:Cation transport protein
MRLLDADLCVSQISGVSLSGSFRKLSKLVVIAVMIRGRHRGLPIAIDRAVLLPRDIEFHDSTGRDHEANRRRSSSLSQSEPNRDAASEAPPVLQGGTPSADVEGKLRGENKDMDDNAGARKHGDRGIERPGTGRDGDGGVTFDVAPNEPHAAHDQQHLPLQPTEDESPTVGIDRRDRYGPAAALSAGDAQAEASKNSGSTDSSETAADSRSSNLDGQGGIAPVVLSGR